MTESFADYAIAHEAGHAVVGKFVKICAPRGISFDLRRDPDGKLSLGDFATAFPFPPDHQIVQLPDAVKNCVCDALAGGLAGAKFSGLPIPNEHDGTASDRQFLSKLTSKSLESFIDPALAVIRQEQNSFKEIVSRCVQRYEALKAENVTPGKQVLLNESELETIFNIHMTPAPSEPNSEFLDTMSAHEAGHAVAGSALGARVEAVYALRADAPNPVSGKFVIRYLTKFGALRVAGLGLKDKILLIAGGTAGEILLNGKSDGENAREDRRELNELGFPNYDYCVEQAVHQLRENHALLLALRNNIREKIPDLKHCKVTRKGTHIILASGSDIAKLYRTLGVSATAEMLELETAKLRNDVPSSTG